MMGYVGDVLLFALASAQQGALIHLLVAEESGFLFGALGVIALHVLP
jgi:hypothetical protein